MRKLFKESKLFKGGNYMRKYGIHFYPLSHKRHLNLDIYQLNMNLLNGGQLNGSDV